MQGRSKRRRGMFLRSASAKSNRLQSRIARLPEALEPRAMLAGDLHRDGGIAGQSDFGGQVYINTIPNYQGVEVCMWAQSFLIGDAIGVFEKMPLAPAFVLILVVLLVRPEGIFGRRKVQRV